MLRQVYNPEQRIGARSSQCCSLLSQVRFVRFISLDYLIVRITCLLGLNILGSNRPVTTLKILQSFQLKNLEFAKNFQHMKPSRELQKSDLMR